MGTLDLYSQLVKSMGGPETATGMRSGGRQYKN